MIPVMTGPVFTPAHTRTSMIKRILPGLWSNGCRVAACCSGKAAIVKVMSDQIDVDVLDVMMPEMDSIETLHSIKNAKPLTEVILLSGKATLETAITGMQQVAFEYLTKPCNADTMTRKIDEAHQHKKEHENRIRTVMAEADAIARHDAGK